MTTKSENSVAGRDDRQEKTTTSKMVALDVDGTLVNHDGVMSESVRQAAFAAAQAGNHLVISTGRSLGAALPVIERIGIGHGFSVCCNGAVTIGLHSDHPAGYQVLERKTFAPGKALAALREVLPSAKFALEDGVGNFMSTSSFQDFSFGIRAREVDFQQLLDAEAVRVVVQSADVPTEKFQQAVREVGLRGVAYSVGWSSWLDIAAQGVSKGSALERLRSHLGVAPENTVAVGDGYNDLEMLSWAHRGVAMGQAQPEVKAAADEVTGSVADDGAAGVLRSLV